MSLRAYMGERTHWHFTMGCSLHPQAVLFSHPRLQQADRLVRVLALESQEPPNRAVFDRNLPIRTKGFGGWVSGF